MNRRDDPPKRSGEKHGGEKTEQEALVEEVWRAYLNTGTHYKDRRYRQWVLCSIRGAWRYGG
jgi:hypothetical protein